MDQQSAGGATRICVSHVLSVACRCCCVPQSSMSTSWNCSRGCSRSGPRRSRFSSVSQSRAMISIWYVCRRRYPPAAMLPESSVRLVNVVTCVPHVCVASAAVCVQITYARYLTSGYLKQHEAEYAPFVEEGLTVDQFRTKQVSTRTADTAVDGRRWAQRSHSELWCGLCLCRSSPAIMRAITCRSCACRTCCAWECAWRTWTRAGSTGPAAVAMRHRSRCTRTTSQKAHLRACICCTDLATTTCSTLACHHRPEQH